MNNISFIESVRYEVEQRSKGHGEKYPVFEGTVLAVSGQIIEAGETYSIVDYLPKGEKLPEPTLATLLLEDEKEKIKTGIASVTKRAFVPMDVHPEVLNRSEVKAYIQKIKEGEQSMSLYILEIIKGRSKAGSDIMIGFAEAIDGNPEHTGFKYIKRINEGTKPTYPQGIKQI